MAFRYAGSQAMRAYKSKPVQQRKRIYGRAGIQLYKDVKYLKGLINSELHYDYSPYTGQVIDTAGKVYHLTAIGQGDTNATRSGNTILPRYMTVMIKLENSVIDFETVRVLLFRWKDSSTPVVADLFEDNSAPVYSPLNDNITGNLRDRQIDVLKDEWFTLGGDSMTRGSVFVKYQLDLNPSSKNIKDHIKYDNAVTTSPSGGIYLVLIGRNTGLNATNFEGSHKLTFYDN